MVSTNTIATKTFFEEANKNLILSDSRKELLLTIANKIADEYLDREKINLNFICTHNSRRSQLSQVWAFYAAEYFHLENVFSYSGGTEATAFYRNTVRTLQKVGFNFNVVDFSHQNPRYLISFKGSKKSIIGFSKVYDDENNAYPYIAITTCNSADENCPFIPDAIYRFHLPFVDPKSSDGTDLQDEKYLEINQQIAGEIFFIFNEIKSIIKEAN